MLYSSRLYSHDNNYCSREFRYRKRCSKVIGGCIFITGREVTEDPIEQPHRRTDGRTDGRTDRQRNHYCQEDKLSGLRQGSGGSCILIHVTGREGGAPGLEGPNPSQALAITMGVGACLAGATFVCRMYQLPIHQNFRGSFNT